jgi:nucleoside-diphosphate-sugar epimerase
MKKILIIGAAGQIGSELTLELREIYGGENVIAGEIKEITSEKLLNSGPVAKVDITDINNIADVVKKYNVDAIISMAAILSACGEQNPQLAWNVNMNGFINVLEVARELKLKQVFNPSSIAAFGPSTPRNNTPQETVLKPTSMYGVTKVAGELIADYYVFKYGMDVRGLRYPGIISNETLPGGGTTDYAVAIYYEAIKNKKYTCFLKEDTMLPMMYMPDCLKATIDLFQADYSKLKHHSDFNLAAMSFTPAILAESIKKHIPEFTIDYKIDFRQAIADSWPRSIDDSAAREEWGWKPSYDLDAMTADMLKVLGEKHKKGLF